MSLEQKETQASPSENNQQMCQNVVTRVASLELVSSTYDKVVTAYAATKDDHPVVKAVCNVTERGVKTAATVAADSMQPILTRLEPQIAVVNEYACQGLDKLEQKLPVLQQPVDKVISDTKELLSSTVAGAKDAICNTIAEAKNAVTGMVDMAKEAVQGNVEATITAVTSSMTSAMESTVGQKLASNIDVLLGKSEDWVDHFLPMTDEELAKLAASIQGPEVVSVEQQKLQKSYYVRLGSLSTKVRQRAYQHSLAKIKQMSQNTKKTLSQLQQTIDLIVYSKQTVDQKLHDVQVKFNKMWLEWHTQQLETSEDESLAKPEQVESWMLEVSCNITEHLQATCSVLAASIHGLPDNVQENVRQFQRSIDDLHAHLTAAASLQDSSGSILIQSKQKVMEAYKSLDELLDYVAHNVPLTWLVGPFMPSVSSAGSPEENDQPASPYSLNVY